LETEVWLPCARIGTIEVTKEKIVPIVENPLPKEK
jgi:hypothetical protein